VAVAAAVGVGGLELVVHTAVATPDPVAAEESKWASSPAGGSIRTDATGPPPEPGAPGAPLGPQLRTTERKRAGLPLRAVDLGHARGQQVRRRHRY
jgi:hypothetical protein